MMEPLEILRKIGSFFLNFVQAILLFASFLLVLYIFVVQPHQVDGLSMFPTFMDKEWLFSNLLAQKTTLQRGDVIVFHSPVEKEKIYIKRVIGISGDSVMLKDGLVYINNERLDEKAYIQPEVMTYGGAFLSDGVPTTVPQEHYFVIGDNRPGSSDSRAWGFLKFDRVIGTSKVRILPVNKFTVITNPYQKK